MVALAVIAGGVYFLTSGGSGDVADSTRGYKLTPPASVEDYTKDASKPAPSGPVTGEDKAEAEAMGVKDANKAGAQYKGGSEDNPSPRRSSSSRASGARSRTPRRRSTTPSPRPRRT